MQESRLSNFVKPYRVGSEAKLGCKIWLRKEKMKEAKELKYLGTILCNYWSMKGKIRERTVKGRQVMGVCWRELWKEEM